MKQMKTYTKNDFHNPEQLTRQQVGAEYRLLLPKERVILPTIPQYIGHGDDGWQNDTGRRESGWTYRVPLATPLPDGTVLSSNECCFSDAPARPRVYVAGPMSSLPDDFNFPAFFKASEELEKQGYEAINPAQLDIDAGYTLEKLKQLSPAKFQEFLKGAVKRDLDAIQTCQVIAMLPGWERSKGAKAELAVAQWLGLDVYKLYRFAEDGEWALLGPCNADEGAVGEEGELGPVDTGYSDHIKQPYNSDERAEWKATAFPMDEYLCSKERITDCGKIDMGDYSSTATAQYAPDDPKGAAGAKKAPMDLLPPDALLETARAMGHGAAKYGRWNFIEAKVCAHTYVAAIGRHWAAYAKGLDDDAESGLKHLAHIAANCFILMTAAQQGTLNDDRPRLK